MENPTVKYGMYYGLAAVVLTMLVYFVSKPLLFNPFLLPGIIFIISIICMVLAARKERDLDADGLLSYGDAVRVTFITAAIGAVIYSIFLFILYRFVDPGLMDIMQAETMAMTENMLSVFGGSEEDVAEAKEAIGREKFEYGIGMTLADIVGSLIGAIIKALIVAIFVKRSS